MFHWIKGGFGRRAEKALKKYQPHLLAHHNQLILNKAKVAHQWMREPEFRHRA